MAKQSARTQAELLLRTGMRATHTPTAKSARQAGNTTQRALQREWESAHKGEEFDPEWFARNVLPGLATKSMPAIAKATGISTTAAGKVRAGHRVPHPRHWEALGALVGVEQGPWSRAQESNR